MEIIHHTARADEMHLVEYFTSKVIVHFFDGRLHIDVKGFPLTQPMTICIEDNTVFDQDAPEPPRKAWERHYSMFTDEGQEVCEAWTKEACYREWPLTTDRTDIVRWIQDKVYDTGLTNVESKVSVNDLSEVFDTAVRESIAEAIDAFIEGRDK